MLLSFSVNAETVSAALKNLGYKNDKVGQVQVLKNITRKGLKKTFTNVKFETDKRTYELEASSPLTAAEFEHEQKNTMGVIVRSYSDQPTPYQGEVTNLSQCPSEFKPKIKEQVKAGTKTISIIESLIDKDFNYGVCDKKLIKYMACSTFYYNSAKSQYLKMKLIILPGKNCQELSLEFFRDLQEI